MAASPKHPLEIESDDEESGDWEEWQATGAEEEEEEEEEAVRCLLCTA